MIGGALRLKIFAPGGRVARVEVQSPRVDPSAVFVGREAEAAAALALQLFALCPVAQSAAARAATGGLVDERRLTLALLCERLAEMLRASLLDWPTATSPGEDIIALRDMLQLLRLIPSDPRGERAAELQSLSARLGLGAAEGFFARQQVEAAADDAEMNLRAGAQDFLTTDDDAAVVAALAVDKAFSRTPSLPGRCVETGVAARRKLAGNGLAARLAAREEDMIETRAAIEQMLAGGVGPAGLLTSGLAGDWRYAAVESARGRLYHACRIDGDGRIADYRIVAPTEWNFHPDGPFVHALLGAAIGVGATAKRRAERLAFVYDPCIKAEASITDA